MKKLLVLAIALLAGQALSFNTATGVVTSIQRGYYAGKLGYANVNVSNYVGGSTIASLQILGGTVSTCGGGWGDIPSKSDLVDFLGNVTSAYRSGTKIQVNDVARDYCSGTNVGYIQGGDQIFLTESR